MTNILLGIILLAILLVIFILLFKKNKNGNDTLSSEFALSRRELSNGLKDLRQEITASLQTNNQAVETKIESLKDKNDAKLEQIRQVVELKLDKLTKDNSEKLERMRQTVDEKLQSTLEKRLTESFKVVSERLELVQRGLGEMKNLASDVGDFKKLLTNVKTRGTWGEVQLENLLEQIFIRDHYEKQVLVDENSKEVVDFVIKLPDKSSKAGFIYLPIDAKFPLEDYQRLVQSQEKNDLVGIEQSKKALINRIKTEAKTIKDKYVRPPKTTDFAILYVPIEGLYAEILHQPGLFEQIQQTYRVTITGPTTIAAILSSFQLGFRSLAIAKQTSGVWELLTTIRLEFGNFGGLLEKTKEKLDQASKTLTTATTKSRTIENKLQKIQTLAIEDKE